MTDDRGICPMTDQPHDYDAGVCCDCDRAEPDPIERVQADEPDDSWVTLALEDAYSLGGDVL